MLNLSVTPSAFALRQAGLEEGPYKQKFLDRIGAGMEEAAPLDEVRWIIEHDLPEVSNIIGLTEQVPGETNLTEDHLRKYLSGKAPDEIFLLATVKSKNSWEWPGIVGIMHLRITEAEMDSGEAVRADILHLMIHPDFDRQEVTEFLLKWFETSHGFSKVPEYVVVHELDDAVREIYSRLGFRARLLPNHFEHTGRDAYEMAYRPRNKRGTTSTSGLEEKPSRGNSHEPEVFVVDPLKIFYRTEQAGALAANLIQGVLIDPEQLPGIQSEDIQILQLTDSQEPAPYTIVVKTDGEIFPQEEIWKQNRVAVITLNPPDDFSSVCSRSPCPVDRPPGR